MNWKILAGALLLASPALAEPLSVNPVPQGTTITPTSASVGTSSAQVLAASSNRNLIVIDNESATATIACAFGATAALNTGGSFTIPPGATRIWNSYPIPLAAINCIASGATTPVTLEIN